MAIGKIGIWYLELGIRAGCVFIPPNKVIYRVLTNINGTD